MFKLYLNIMQLYVPCVLEKQFKFLCKIQNLPLVGITVPNTVVTSVCVTVAAMLIRMLSNKNLIITTLVPNSEHHINHITLYSYAIFGPRDNVYAVIYCQNTSSERNLQTSLFYSHHHHFYIGLFYIPHFHFSLQPPYFHPTAISSHSFSTGG